MTWRVILLGTLRAWLLCASWVGYAQGGAVQPAMSIEDSLRAMSGQAGVIFVGTVLRVTHTGGNDGASAGVVEIAFAVEDAVRGCTAGTVYTLREWGGLWAPNHFRYQVGETKLMLLHAPGPGGISSPVSGMDGVIPVRGNVGTNATDGSTSAAESIVDLRWIATKVARPVVYATEQPNRHLPKPIVESDGGGQVQGSNAVSPKHARSMAIHKTADGRSTGVASISVDSQEASLSTILRLLASWQEEINESR